MQRQREINDNPIYPRRNIQQTTYTSYVTLKADINNPLRNNHDLSIMEDMHRLERGFIKIHPTAYALTLSKVETGDNTLYSIYKESSDTCEEFKRKAESRLKRLSESKASAPTARLKLSYKHIYRDEFRRLQDLDQTLERRRNAAHLLRCLMEIENARFRSYYSWILKDHSESALEKLKQDQNSNEKDLNLLIEEEAAHFAMYLYCRLHQTKKSKELEDILKLSDENKVEKAAVNRLIDYYTKCSGCSLYFKKQRLSLFGSGVDDDSGVCSFYCRECSNPTSLLSMSSLSDLASKEGDTSRLFYRSDSLIPGLITKLEQETVTGKKKRKKKKKKKAAQSSPPSSSLPLGSEPESEKERKEKKPCPYLPLELDSLIEQGMKEKIDNLAKLIVKLVKEICNPDSITSTASFSSFDTELSNLEKAYTNLAKESKGEDSDVSICSPDTITTIASFSSSDTQDFSEGVIRNDGECDNNISGKDDLNELFVEYLWKTGSMIALDKYMDEMDMAPEETILYREIDSTTGQQHKAQKFLPCANGISKGMESIKLDDTFAVNEGELKD